MERGRGQERRREERRGEEGATDRACEIECVRDGESRVMQRG